MNKELSYGSGASSATIPGTSGKPTGPFSSAGPALRLSMSPANEPLTTSCSESPGDLVLLGAHTLEGLNFRIDPVPRQLVDAGPAPAAGASGMASLSVLMERIG